MMLLYSLFNSIRDSLLALSGIPFAACGGILGLYFFGLNFSVSAAVGFISLFGVSAMDGILLVSYIRRRLDEGFGKDEAIIGSAQARMVKGPGTVIFTAFFVFARRNCRSRSSTGCLRRTFPVTRGTGIGLPLRLRVVP